VAEKNNRRFLKGMARREPFLNAILPKSARQGGRGGACLTGERGWKRKGQYGPRANCPPRGGRKSADGEGALALEPRAHLLDKSETDSHGFGGGKKCKGGGLLEGKTRYFSLRA